MHLKKGGRWRVTVAANRGILHYAKWYCKQNLYSGRDCQITSTHPSSEKVNSIDSVIWWEHLLFWQQTVHAQLFFITHWINGITVIMDYKWCMYPLWFVKYMSVFFNVAAVACITVTLVYSGTGDLKHTSCIIWYRFDQIELNQMFSYHVTIILCFEMIM